MKRSKSSDQWMREHQQDQYVKQAKADGYRSRAVYKLQALQERDRLIRPGDTVVDLGAAPGAWSQKSLEWVGAKGRVIGLDLLPIDPLTGGSFIQGDFTEDAVLDQLVSALSGNKVDVVLSDMAPNMSGLTAVDQPKSMYLVELAFSFAEQYLVEGGVFVSKIFHGEGFDQFIKMLRTTFNKVNVRKPDASRPRSKEVYVVAKGRQ